MILLLEVIETSLGLANVLKLNVNELFVLKELLGLRGDERTMLNELSRRYSLRLIALTRGGEGSILYSGDIISIVGNTGEFTSGPHLHLEFWFNGKSINPSEFISF